MKKRILATLLSVCMLATTFAFASAASAAEADRYALKDAYASDTTQGPEWYYMYKQGDNAWAELNYYGDWGDNWQVSTNPSADNIYYSICQWIGVNAQPGVKDGIPYQIGVVFKAPKAGNLLIDAWDYYTFIDDSTPCLDEYKVGIYHGNEVLYTSSTNLTTHESSPILITVEAGDEIRFVTDPNGNTGATISLDSIAVEYVEMESANETSALSDAYTGDSEQGPEWYYMYNKNSTGWKMLNYYGEWGDNWQVSSDPNGDNLYYSLCAWAGVNAQPGDNGDDEYAIGALFHVLQTGTLKIAPWEHFAFWNYDGNEFEMCDDSYRVSILKNGTPIYNGMTNAAEPTSPELTVSVAAGDKILFAVYPNGNTGATINMDDISVTYTEIMPGSQIDPSDEGIEDTPQEPVVRPTPAQPAVIYGDPNCVPAEYSLAKAAASAWNLDHDTIIVETRTPFVLDDQLAGTAKNSGKDLDIRVETVGIADGAYIPVLNYGWLFEAAKLQADITMDLSVTTAVTADGISLGFEHFGFVPDGTTLKLNVSDYYADGTTLSYYYLVDGNYVKDASAKVENGVAALAITRCGNGLLTDKVL